jgi:hypothetical protein
METDRERALRMVSEYTRALNDLLQIKLSYRVNWLEYENIRAFDFYFDYMTSDSGEETRYDAQSFLEALRDGQVVFDTPRSGQIKVEVSGSDSP